MDDEKYKKCVIEQPYNTVNGSLQKEMIVVLDKSQKVVGNSFKE